MTVLFWPFADIFYGQLNVCFTSHRLAAMSANDPKRTRADRQPVKPAECLSPLFRHALGRRVGRQGDPRVA